MPVIVRTLFINGILHKMLPGNGVKKKLQVMVVDDTITYRMIIKNVAEGIPHVQVMATASNGKLAFDKLSAAKEADLPHVVLLDVEMPVLDGISTLKKIRQRFPNIAVVMISALSRSNANIIVECLNAGALDFVTKPLESHAERAKMALRKDLEPILTLVIQNLDLGASSLPESAAVVSAVEEVAPRRLTPRPGAAPPVVARVLVASDRSPALPVVPVAPVVPLRGQQAVNMARFHPELVLIGSSTGGPAALTMVLRSLGSGKSLAVPILIVQHMPPIFTTSLAAQLSRASGLSVKEAEDEMLIGPGSVILARGGQHMTVRRKDATLMARVTDGPKVNECRPAVDVLFMSVMTEFTGPVLAVILTGMGRDGTNGVDALKRVGNTYCITQEKTSCVVYGMPRSVDEKGLSDESLPLEQIGPKIAAICLH